MSDAITSSPINEERKEESMLSEIETLLLLALAVAAWVRYAEHPTAHNLRTAIADTLSL